MIVLDVVTWLALVTLVVTILSISPCALKRNLTDWIAIMSHLAAAMLARIAELMQPKKNTRMSGLTGLVQLNRTWSYQFLGARIARREAQHG